MIRNLKYFGLLLLSACTLQETSLYQNGVVEDTRPHIGNFYALQIYDDGISPDMWITEKRECVKLDVNDSIFSEGSSSMELEWDKQAGGCDWVGMGFGWDGWSGKDLSQSFSNMAIQMKMRAYEGTLKSLPLALALEDYGGQQAFAGFSRKYIQNKLITDKEWSNIIVPLSDFPVKGYDVETNNIKQFVIQFEASGHILIDDIRIIEHEGGSKNKAVATVADERVIVNGKAEIDEWGEPSLNIDQDRIHIKYDQDNLYVMAYIFDENPLMNTKDDAEMWNGDCLEIAFSTNPESPADRPMYGPTDHQIGIKLVAQPYAYDWKSNTRIETAKTGLAFTSDGILVEVQIPLSHFGNEQFEYGSVVGLEIAIDRGSENGRYQQSRWNEPDVGGFYQSPNLWGKLQLNVDQP